MLVKMIVNTTVLAVVQAFVNIEEKRNEDDTVELSRETATYKKVLNLKYWFQKKTLMTSFDVSILYYHILSSPTDFQSDFWSVWYCTIRRPDRNHFLFI